MWSQVWSQRCGQACANEQGSCRCGHEDCGYAGVWSCGDVVMQGCGHVRVVMKRYPYLSQPV